MITAIVKRIRNLPSWLFWIAMALMGVLIIIFNDAFGDHDAFAIFGLLYFSFLLFATVKWIFAQIRSVITLKKEKTKMEMLHLKSQVNPHFFFNTLNNLYGLVIKDPKEAQSLILKLSDLMRYSIYEGQSEWVTLEEEISYLKNYVGLHQNRYHKEVEIKFNFDVDDQAYNIMPLLLILIVENAFKHGVEKMRNGAFVTMELIAQDGRIDFTTINNYDREDIDGQATGIGISNLKRRLEIGYKKDFDLSINMKDETFEVKLALHKV